MSAEPLLLAFCCQCCAYTAADVAGAMRVQYPSNVRILRFTCAGSVEPNHILAAFEQGVDGAIVAGCLPGECHFGDGNLRAQKRVERVQELLQEIGLEPERLEMVMLSSAEGVRFAQLVTEMTKRITRLGPSPLRPAPELRSAVGRSKQGCTGEVK
jgi:F420-non-reducing hydrogenase iron-sulfur subunit